MGVVDLTEAARNHLRDLLTASGETAILLWVNAKGCGGHSYEMAFADRNATGEVIDLGGGHRLIVEQRSLIWLWGVGIDYRDEGLERRMVFDNPRETARCGCGESFRLG